MRPFVAVATLAVLAMLEEFEALSARAPRGHWLRVADAGEIGTGGAIAAAAPTDLNSRHFD